MLCDRFDIGGAETHILTLSNALCARGHTVTLLTEGGSYLSSLHKNIRVKCFPFLSRSRAPSVFLSLSHFLRAEKFDVLHAHTRITAFYCRLLAPARTVVTAHWVFDTHFPKRQLSFWGTETLAVSEDIKRYLHHAYRLPIKQIRVTVNGIDPVQFTSGERQGVTKICLCSRLDSDRADAAFALLRAAAPLSDTHDFSLSVIGDGNAMPDLKALAKALMSKHPHFHPVFHGARTDVSHFLTQTDIFVGVSRAALEAMASGCAVILAGNEGYLSVFDPQNADEAEASNFCCRGVSSVSGEALTRDLKTLLCMGREERLRLGEACRAYVTRRYSVSRMVKDALLCYEACVKRKAVLCGYYGAGNVGDELLKGAITRRLRKEGYAQVLPLSLRHLSPKAVYALLSRYDFFLGGGNLLQDATSRRSLGFYLFLLSLAQRRGCETALISAGIGPLSASGRARVRPSLAKLGKAECRTREDCETARALGVKRVSYRPDAVLSLALPPKKRNGSRVMLAFRPSRFAYAVAKEAVRHYPKDCFFFAMHPADASFGRRLADSLSIPFHSGEVSVFLSDLRECALVLGDRLHAGVCALGMELPFFLDGQDEKCARFLADVKKAAKDGGFCGDIRKEFPKVLPGGKGIKEAKRSLLIP